jgi:hypothetical protein
MGFTNTTESYPTPTSGLGIGTWLALTGNQVSNANPQSSAPNSITYGGNNTYKLTLSLANSPTVSITVNLYDNAQASQSLTKSLLQVDCYNANPTTAAGTQESYPAPVSTVGSVITVSSVGGAGGTTSATFTLTANAKGNAHVDVSYPFGGNTIGTVSAGPADGTYNRGQAGRPTVVTGSNLLQWPINEIYATLLVLVET